MCSTFHRGFTKAIIAWATSLAILTASPSFAQQPRASGVVIWISHADAPQRAFYQTLAESVKRRLSRAGIEVTEKVIREGRDADQVDGDKLVVAIGASAAEWARARVPPTSLVLGGTRLTSDDARRGGVSLEGDPLKAFETLKQLSPATQRVVVVYPPRLEWLMDAARMAAKKVGLQLVTYVATDINTASIHYMNVLNYANPTTDAIWLLQGDELVSADVTLPVLVEEGWTKRFVIFSDVLEHANRGVLFATYPDPTEVGEQLSDMALRKLRSERVTIEPHRPGRAVNTRIAVHLGITMDRIVRSKIERHVGG